MVDTDNSGFVSKRELVSFLKKVGMDFETTNINEIIERIDKDHNNKIDFNEFYELYID